MRFFLDILDEQAVPVAPVSVSTAAVPVRHSQIPLGRRGR